MTPEDKDEALNTILLETLKERRRARRWGIFFKLFMAGYLAVVFMYAASGRRSEERTASHDPFVAVVELNGEISSENGIDAATFNENLRAALDAKHVKGILIDIDSPGGLPVESDLMYIEILRQREAHPDIPIYAVIRNIGASGAYYVASAAESIYASPASLIGSIGVISTNFGVIDLMDKIGVESRIRSSGDLKTMASPFAPVTREATAILDSILSDIHDTFIQAVMTTRSDKLTDDPDLFSGRIWSGRQALNVGLIDDFGTIDSVARNVFEVENIIHFNGQSGFFTQMQKKLHRLQTKVLSPMDSLRVEAKI